MTVRGSTQYVTPEMVRAHLAASASNRARRNSWHSGRYITGNPAKNEDAQPFVWWPGDAQARDWVLS